MFPCHLLGSEGKNNGDDRTECLRYSCYSKCHGKQECLSPGFSPENADSKQNTAENQDYNGQFLAKLVQVHLQRCLFLRCGFQQFGNFTNLSLHTDGGYKKRAPSVGDKTSREYHIGSVTQRHLTYDGIFCRIHTQALTCKRTLIYF